MKTNKFFYIAAFVFFGLMSSCELQREEFDRILPENFYKNEEDIKSAVTAAYNNFHINSYGGGGVYSSGIGGINIYTEVSTDIMDCQWGDNGNWELFNTHNWTAADPRYSANLYAKYKNVSQIRNIILQIEKSEVRDELKQRYIGELKALRGWLLYCLLDIYGPVPIAPDEALKDPVVELILERPAETEYVAQVESELKDAIRMLPLKGSEWGRVGAGAANMMLLKLYMHQKRWKEGEAIGRELMNAKYGYRLLDNYYDCFSLNTEVNNENIWVIPCNNENYANGWISHVLPGDYPYPNPAVEAWSGYRMPWDFYHTFEKKDKRLANIISEYVSKADGITVRNEQNPAGELIKGALPVKYTVDPNQKGDRGGIDVPVFRYSDVLLTLAESIARQGTVTQECMDLVNTVRRRAGLENLSLANYGNLNNFLDMLLLERGHELYCEGHRRTDLIRYGKYVEFNRLVANSHSADYKVLFPIPNSYLLESKGKIKQNTGY